MPHETRQAWPSLACAAVVAVVYLLAHVWLPYGVWWWPPRQEQLRQVPRVGLVLLSFGATSAQTANNIAFERRCYCRSQLPGTCAVHLARARRLTQLWPTNATIPVPWYSTPLRIGAVQQTLYVPQEHPGRRGLPRAVNRPGWPRHHFAKLVALALAWRKLRSPEWMWYADLDTRILNYSVPITQFLPHDPSIGLVVVDAPFGSVCAGVYLVRTRGEGLTILREWWEAQQAPWLEKRWAKALGDQAALVSLILRRTASRTGVVYRDECEREPWTLVDGGIDQCFMYWMARLGSPYGNRTVTRGVHFVHPAGADFQAFSYLGYGERSRARLNLKARNPQIPGALGVELPWHAGMDWVFQPGDLLVHSAHLKRLRNFWPDDAPVNGSVAADAMTTCAVRPNVTYHRRHGRLVFELRGQKQRGTMR